MIKIISFEQDRHGTAYNTVFVVRHAHPNSFGILHKRHNIIWSIVMGLNIVPKDTTLEVARIQFSIFRKIGIVERANMTIELSDGLRATIQSGVRQRHPEYNDNMVRLAALQLAIGEQLFRQAYPDIKVKG